MSAVQLIALPGVPPVKPGDGLAALALAALRAAGLALEDGDILVYAQKIVSKAENRFVALGDVAPSPRALGLARAVEKDPRLVECILRESRRIVRQRKDVLIVEHRLGLVMANAGIDQSNVDGGESRVLLLPENPDASAQALRDALAAATGKRLGVIINDSFGRAWRRGTVGVAIGAAGVESVIDARGAPDLFGRPLRVTLIGHADEIAAAASLVMGQGGEGRPIVLVRGLDGGTAQARAADILRGAEEDLFR